MDDGRRTKFNDETTAVYVNFKIIGMSRGRLNMHQFLVITGRFAKKPKVQNL